MSETITSDLFTESLKAMALDTKAERLKVVKQIARTLRTKLASKPWSKRQAEIVVSHAMQDAYGRGYQAGRKKGRPT